MNGLPHLKAVSDIYQADMDHDRLAASFLQHERAAHVPSMTLLLRDVDYRTADDEALTADELEHVLYHPPATPPQKIIALDSCASANDLRHPLFGEHEGGEYAPLIEKNALYTLENRDLPRQYQVDHLLPPPLTTFRTDEHGRPVVTSLLLTNGANVTRGNNDSKIGKRAGRDRQDVGFHLAAKRFGGTGGPANIVPGDTELNSGAYFRYEDKLAKIANAALRMSKGKPFAEQYAESGEFIAHYLPENTTYRPDMFEIRHWRAPLTDPSRALTPRKSMIFQNGVRTVEVVKRNGRQGPTVV